MPGLPRARRALAALALPIALARVAAGQSALAPEREKVRLVFDAPATCEGREQFLPQVRARLGSSWEAAPGELARTIHVSVSTVGQRYLARIELQDARGRQVARAVAGARCEQVIEGIALITALAIEAQIEELISRSEPIAEAAGPVTARPAPPNAPAQAAEGNRASPVDSGRPSPASSSGMHLRLGGRFVIQQGAGPGLGTGLGASAALVWQHVVLGLTVDATGTGEVESQGVRARFDLVAARLEACGRWPWLSASILVEPCLFAQAGSLNAEGVTTPPEVTRASRGATAWLSPGVLVGLRGELSPVFLGLEASAGLSLDREVFYVDAAEGQRDVYEVPWLAAGAALSLGVIF